MCVVLCFGGVQLCVMAVFEALIYAALVVLYLEEFVCVVVVVVVTLCGGDNMYSNVSAFSTASM